MKTLKNKMKNKKGFTLMEMLIVVAIMVVLVAVAVPTFTSQINRANEAADDANLKAAKAVAMSTFLLDPSTAGTKYFNPDKGDLTGSASDNYGKDGEHDVIKIEFVADTEPVVGWVTENTEGDED